MESNHSKPLIDLILEENNKIPNIEGNTPLTLRAINNSKHDNYSKEKEIYEMEVCSIVKHLAKFNQTHFAELDSYISVSKFNIQKILEAFSDFIKEVNVEENINLKGYILRFIQSYNKSLFSLDYVKNRFDKLKDKDPWLFAELIIAVNWDEGVMFISNILKINNNTNYLFGLISSWVKDSDNEENLNLAFKTWVKYFNSEDKDLLKEFCKQYSFEIPITEEYSNSINITSKNEFKQFKSSVEAQRRRTYALI